MSNNDIKIAIETLNNAIGCATDNETVRDLEFAIFALEKQIPKKMEHYQCPDCRHYFEDGEPHTYCPCCGQKLIL